MEAPKDSESNPMSLVRILTGHSGAEIALHEVDGIHFVRKKSGSEALNERLEAQASKQDGFFNAGGPCPRVIGRGRNAGLFFFDMEYVAGTSVAYQCQSAIMPDRGDLAAFLGRWIRHFQATADGELGAHQYLSKLASIRKSASSSPLLGPVFPRADKIIDLLSGVDWSGIPQSNCHGDMTLENILVTRHGYCFIDFDVPDLPSYYMDIAKLFQDIDGHWCLRHMAHQSSDDLHYLNAQQVLLRLRTTILSLVREIAPDILARLRFLVALNLLRTVPYCRDISVASYALDRIMAILSDPTEPV